ncbi:MAG: hypothetical protein ACLUAR_05070 [Pilosibacter sp.]
MKKAGKIVIGLVCVGAFGALMFIRFTKKKSRFEAVPNSNRRRPDTGDRKY